MGKNPKGHGLFRRGPGTRALGAGHPAYSGARLGEAGHPGVQQEASWGVAGHPRPQARAPGVAPSGRRARAGHPGAQVPGTRVGGRGLG